MGLDDDNTLSFSDSSSFSKGSRLFLSQVNETENVLVNDDDLVLQPMEDFLVAEEPNETNDVISYDTSVDSMFLNSDNSKERDRKFIPPNGIACGINKSSVREEKDEESFSFFQFDKIDPEEGGSGKASCTSAILNSLPGTENSVSINGKLIDNVTSGSVAHMDSISLLSSITIDRTSKKHGALPANIARKFAKPNVHYKTLKLSKTTSSTDSAKKVNKSNIVDLKPIKIKQTKLPLSTPSIQKKKNDQIQLQNISHKTDKIIAPTTKKLSIPSYKPTEIVKERKIKDMEMFRQPLRKLPQLHHGSNKNQEEKVHIFTYKFRQNRPKFNKTKCPVKISQVPSAYNHRWSYFKYASVRKFLLKKMKTHFSIVFKMKLTVLGADIDQDIVAFRCALNLNILLNQLSKLGESIDTKPELFLYMQKFHLILNSLYDRRIFSIEKRCCVRILLLEPMSLTGSELLFMEIFILSNKWSQVEKAVNLMAEELPTVYKKIQRVQKLQSDTVS